MDWAAAHALSDQMGYGAQEQRFETFHGFFLDYLAGLVRAHATGAGEPPVLMLAQRLIPEGKLPQWAAFWEAALREKDEAVELNLDRKALVVGLLARLQVLSRE
jgi:hypothetical protein